MSDDEWVTVPPRKRIRFKRGGGATLYIRPGCSPILRLRSYTFSQLGEPNRVLIKVRPKTGEIFLEASHTDKGRRIVREYRTASGVGGSVISVAGVPELFDMNTDVHTIIRYRAVLLEEGAVVLTPQEKSEGENHGWTTASESDD